MDHLTDTLLENIPKELLNIIEYNINAITARRNEDIVALHEKYGFQTHMLCHICKLHEAIFFLDKDPVASDFSTHPCCSHCINQKKYRECIECYQTMKQLHIDIKKRYVDGAKDDEDLLIKLGRCGANMGGRMDMCHLCFPHMDYHEREPYCISCGYKHNLIKCYHDTIHGKRIIYICSTYECNLLVYRSMVEVVDGHIDEDRFVADVD